jgi:ferritin-like metal-binding protein YciE
MEIKDAKDLFVLLLSHVRQGTERSAKIYTELTEIAQDENIREVLDARGFLSKKILSTLDECFKIIGEKPVETSGRLREVFMEDFRKELGSIKNPVAKRVFVLAKAQHLIHLQIGEYKALIAAADVTGNYEVGLLLESCLADKLVMVERARRAIRTILKSKVAEKMAARVS